MQNTYAQKQKTAQKKDAPTAAAVLDSSSQSEGLQRKADMANGAAQREETPRPNNTGMPDNNNTALAHKADVINERTEKTCLFSQLKRVKIPEKTSQLQIGRDKLNVIGENHPESRGREPAEQKLLLDKTGSSNYETEATFKTINEEFGDPPILRFPQGILFHEKSMNALFEEFGKMPSENAQTYYTLATNYLRSAEVDLDNIPKDSIFTDKINASKKICCKLRAIPKIILQAIITKNSNLFDNEKKDWIEHINEIKSYFQFENISIEQQVKRRSFAMHWAAVAASKHGKRGTWKIGNDHCNDILTYLGNPIDYHLTTRDEFYQALSTYPPNKPQPPLPPQAPVRPTNTDEKKSVP